MNFLNQTKLHTLNIKTRVTSVNKKLTKRFTTRTDDSHATLVFPITEEK